MFDNDKRFFIVTLCVRLTQMTRTKVHKKPQARGRSAIVFVANPRQEISTKGNTAHFST